MLTGFSCSGFLPQPLQRSGRFLRETFEAVREDKKGRRPQSDKDAKSFTVCLGVDGLTPCQKPDGDRADNRAETEDEAEFAEKLVLSGFHIASLDISGRDEIAQCVFFELTGHLVVLEERKSLMPQQGISGCDDDGI